MSSPSLVGKAFRWKHMAYVSEGVLTALDHYIQNFDKGWGPYSLKEG